MSLDVVAGAVLSTVVGAVALVAFVAVVYVWAVVVPRPAKRLMAQVVLLSIIAACLVSLAWLIGDAILWGVAEVRGSRP